MPIYEYKCERCILLFERKQKFSDEPVAAYPKRRRKARRLIQPVPIIFKGSGFYVTDSRGGS